LVDELLRRTRVERERADAAKQRAVEARKRLRADNVDIEE